MNRLFEIASELGEIAHERYDLKQQLDTINRNIKTQEAAIIPVGGWPGSNADTRKAAEFAAKAGDEALQMFGMDKDAVCEEMDKLEIDREVLIAERDAWQWTIRDREACAHEGGQMYSVFALMDAYQTEQEYIAQMEAEEATKDPMAETTESMNGDELDLLTQTADDDPPF